MTVHKTGPWGQGPALLQALRILDAKGIADLESGSAPWIHAVVETLKLSFADRDAWFGDPDHVDVPLDRLFSPGYAGSRAAIIEDAASLDLRPGDPAHDGTFRSGDTARGPGGHSREFGHDGTSRPGGVAHGPGGHPENPSHDGESRCAARDSAMRNRQATAPAVAALLALAAAPEDMSLGGGEPTFAALPEVEGDTVQLDVADRWGNLVAATPSGGWLQGAPAVPGLGFNVTTRGQMFWLDERLPSHLAPGRRPRTTLTPTVLARGDRPVVGLGKTLGACALE